MKKIKMVGIGILVLLGLFCVFTTIKTFLPKNIKSTYILKEIKSSSELTTAKITYQGIHHYEDDGIKFLNKSNFTMIYRAVIRTGIDLNKVDVDVSNVSKKVIITIPMAKVLDINIDENSIEYYDTKFAPFNLDSKEDVKNAIIQAKEDINNNVIDEIDLDVANKQSELLIRGLVQKLVPNGYDIEVIHE